MKAAAQKTATTMRKLVLGVRPQGERATILLPEPPSVNDLYGNSPKGRRRTLTYSRWLKAALSEIVIQFIPFVPGNVTVSAIVPRKNARRDIDNTIKACLDALVKGYVIEDDNKVVELHFKWGAQDRCSIVVEKEKE